MGKLFLLIAIFLAGWLWGDIAVAHALEVWNGLCTAASTKMGGA
tara:strand:+ start:545 stop:676 length:132 start_codon:yes stop_codon:yes gene_type:complete